jgi:MYXO-CTERM domain-containing protein
MTRKTLVCALVLASHTGTAVAYNLKTTNSGASVRWAEGPIAIDIGASNGSERGAPGAATGSIAAGFHAWEQELDGAMLFEMVARDEVDLEVTSKDRINVVRWVYDGWAEELDLDENALAMTLTTYKSHTGRIVDSDVLINAERYDWTAGPVAASCGGAYDVQNVITHEAGHLLGLDHEAGERESTMYPSSGMCETKKRTLEDDDRSGVQALYLDTEAPEAPAAMGCSVGGGGNAAGAWLIVFAMLVASRRRSGAIGARRAVAGLAVVAAMFAAGAPANATALRGYSVADMVDRASVVARGTVIEQRSLWSGDRIYTDSVLAVTECWAGTCASSVTIRQLGGEVGEDGMWVEGTAPLAVGDDVVAFLRPRRDGSFAPTGMAQGVFHIRGTLAHRDLRSVTVIQSTSTGATQLSEAATHLPGSLETRSLSSLRSAVNDARRHNSSR